MARVTNEALIQLQGKVGSLVFRTVNGKKFVSLRPDEYKKSKSPKAIYEKTKFASAVKFGKCANSIYFVKQAWEESALQGITSYHRMLKTNLLLHTTPNGHELFSIFPPAKKKSLSQISFIDDKILLTFSHRVKRSLNLVLVSLYAYKIQENSKLEFRVLFSKEIKGPILNDAQLILEANELSRLTSFKYFYQTIFFAVAFTNSKGNIESYSNTITL